MGWIKDAIAAAREVHRVRRAGITGELALIAKEDLELKTYETNVDRKYHKLLYQCVEDMAHGRSRCRYCEEYGSCQNKRRGNVRGCSEWWLRFLTEEEDKECKGIYEQAAKESPEEDQAAGIPRPDEGTAGGGADQERDHDGGSEG